MPLFFLKITVYLLIRFFYTKSNYMKKVFIILASIISLQIVAQSTSPITVTNDMIFDLNGRKGKSLKPMFDGTLTTSFDVSGINESQFVLPFRSFVVLPNTYTNLAFQYYDSFGTGGNFALNFYDASKNLVGTYTLTDSGFQLWRNLNTTNLNTLTNVRFMEMVVLNQTGLSTLFEFKLFGDVITTAASIFSGASIIPRPDAGVKGHGINTLDDRINHYDVSNSIRIIDRLAKTMRVGYEGPRFNLYPDAFVNPLSSAIFNLSRFGTDHLNTRVFNISRPNNIDVQLYHTGGSLKNLTVAQASLSNSTFISQAQDYKHIEPAADPLIPATWDGLARIYSKLAALYGNNTSANTSSVQGGNAAAGQGGLTILEIGNEWNADWKSNGAVFYHTPEVYYTALKQVYNAVKLQDPTMKVYSAALTYMDVSYWRALYFHHYWKTNATTAFPVDGINMNLYINSVFDGQGGNPTEVAVSPEVWNLEGRLANLQLLFNQLFPNVPLVVSETGFATDNGSFVDVDPIGSKTDRQVSADMELRFKAIAQTNTLVARVVYYALFEDGTSNFNSMAAINDQFNGFGGAYSGSTVFPIGYCLANELQIEQFYSFGASLAVNGGTNNVWVTQKNHNTNSLKKLFKVWLGSSSGAISAYTLNVGANAISANLYKLNYANYSPITSSISIANNAVAVVAEEGMQWVEVTYQAAQAPSSSFNVTQNVCINQAVNLNDQSSNSPTSWVWTMAGATPSTSTLQNPTITFTNSGTYTISLVASSTVGVGTPISQSINVSNCLDVKTKNEIVIPVSILPNPTTGMVSINCMSELPKQITITDITGRIIHESITNETNYIIDLNFLSNGLYYVKLMVGEKSSVMKLVKN
jgi:PKD repeat protein